MDLEPGWVVVVPVKELQLAKTRLHHLAAADRADLAAAMARDVVVAATRAELVDGVVVVTNDPRAAADAAAAGARVIADFADRGIDEALADGERDARSLWPRAGVAALSGDLPCLTSEVLDLALSRASRTGRSVVADRHDVGTTLLTAAPGVALSPRYGEASRARHVLDGATQVDSGGLERLTLDVDTPRDLADAVALGVGPSTSAVMLRLGPALG